MIGTFRRFQRCSGQSSDCASESTGQCAVVSLKALIIISPKTPVRFKSPHFTHFYLISNPSSSLSLVFAIGARCRY